MRPPEFTGGNSSASLPVASASAAVSFNEAAGIHRRKLMLVITITAWLLRFNEAAGIHRRKRGGLGGGAHRGSAASMRPPEFTGGNVQQGQEDTS